MKRGRGQIGRTMDPDLNGACPRFLVPNCDEWTRCRVHSQKVGGEIQKAQKARFDRDKASPFIRHRRTAEDLNDRLLAFMEPLAQSAQVIPAPASLLSLELIGDGM
jgi:hypothetical protein